MEYEIRPIKKESLSDLIHLIKELAIYEHMEDLMTATKEDFKKLIFDEKIAICFMAFVDEKAVGYALFFKNISTFKGKAGLFLEDLFVLKEARGKGIGKALITKGIEMAKEQGLGRYEWTCLDWNTPSQKFYESMGAKRMKSWWIYRVESEDFESFGKQGE